MGYACPVCETPTPDAEHLANHLAFTAMLGDDDHEAWLDEHAPEWSEDGEDELAARIEEYAKEVGFPQVFDDTVDRNSTSNRAAPDDTTHDHGSDGRFEDELERANTRGRGSMASGAGALDADAQQILQEAQEMTRQMLDDEDGEESSGSEEE